MSKTFKSALQAHLETCPSRDAIKGLDQLDPLSAAQATLIGNELLGFFHNGGLEMILKQRFAFKKIKRFDPEPVLILTTDLPGLTACSDLFEDNDRIISLLPSEWTPFQQAFDPHDSCEAYIHHWCYVAPCTGQELLAQARQEKPELRPDDLWELRRGEIWGPRMGQEILDLWCWENNDFELVKLAASHIQF